jgi:hypothetical protein
MGLVKVLFVMVEEEVALGIGRRLDECERVDSVELHFVR